MSSIYRTKDSAVIKKANYVTETEKVLIVLPYENQGENDKVKITLNHSITQHIVIKAMTDCIIYSPQSFDLEYDEMELSKFASIELKNIANNWYILSSDGMKNS
jgi:hypothetical protein